MSIQYLVHCCIAVHLKVQGLTLSCSLCFVSMIAFICYFPPMNFLIFFLFKLSRALNGLMTPAHIVSKFSWKHYAAFQKLASQLSVAAFRECVLFTPLLPMMDYLIHISASPLEAIERQENWLCLIWEFIFSVQNPIQVIYTAGLLTKESENQFYVIYI